MFISFLSYTYQYLQYEVYFPLQVFLLTDGRVRQKEQCIALVQKNAKNTRFDKGLSLVVFVLILG